MNQALLLSVLKDVVVPEIATFIALHYRKTGELPTQEELQSQIDSLASQIVMKAEALVTQVYKDHPELDPNVSKS